MLRLNSLLAGAAVLWPLCLQAQSQPEISAILQRLDRLEKENRELADEVRSLRARLDGAPTAQVADSAQPSDGVATTDEKLQIQERRIEELAQSKVESSQKFPVRLTGTALFNAFMNSKQSGGSEYPVVASPPGMASTGATMRQTILGLEFRGPSTILGGTVHGSVYMDFFGGTANQAVRMRTGSIEIDWRSTNLMVGIEKPIFNPREPSSLAQLAVSPLTGAGNLWLWLPQARLEQDLRIGSSSGLRARLGVIQTREAGPYAGSNITGNLEPSRPGLEGRLELFHNLDDDRRIEFASGFHVSQTHIGGFSVASQIFSMDWFANPWRRLEFTGAFYTGQNVTPLGAGYQQGFGGYRNHVLPVGSMGGWGQATLHLAPRLDLHLFSGQQDDKNSDLDPGRIGKNLLFGGNLYYHLAPNVILGLETTQLRTTYIGQGVRINNHYDLALAYLF